MQEDLQALVASVASEEGLRLTSDQVERLVRYVELTCRWGRRIDLTARPEPRRLIEHHLVDGLVLASLAAPLGPGAAVDVGSGAGFTGVPLALLVPGLRVTLVEPRQRRSAFLRAVNHELALGMEVLAERLEALQLPPQDLAVSQATWPPAEWLPRAATLVRPGGTVAALLARASQVPPPPPGLVEVERRGYTLADGTPRLLLCCRRLGEAP